MLQSLGNRSHAFVNDKGVLNKNYGNIVSFSALDSKCSIAYVTWQLMPKSSS